MNNTEKLLRVFEENNFEMSLLDLAQKYSYKYHIVNDNYFQNAIKKVLQSNKALFRFNLSTGLWEVGTDISYLYVSENKRFKKIRDAMLEVFAKRVNSGGAYFPVDDTHNAWFPQFKNEDWENTLSEDGQYWFERPKNGADYAPDYKLRYVFAHEKDGYRFTGLFEFIELKDDKTRVYKLIDNKVLIIKPVNPMLVCRITWMKEYQGITEWDKPTGGGSYVDEFDDAFEKYNFTEQEDGLVHGFVETKYRKGHMADEKYANSLHIENLDASAKNSSEIKNIRVVFVSYNPNIGKTVIVGWYDNATVYRNRFEYNGFYTTMTCAKENAHLIPVEERIFKVPKAGKETAFGIGQSNVWYIQNNSAAKDFEEKINAYLDSMI